MTFTTSDGMYIETSRVDLACNPATPVGNPRGLATIQYEVTVDQVHPLLSVGAQSKFHLFLDYPRNTHQSFHTRLPYSVPASETTTKDRAFDVKAAKVRTREA